MPLPSLSLRLAAVTLCVLPASSQQLLTRTVDVQGVSRSYLLYVPASYAPVELTGTTLPTGAITAGERRNFQYWFRDAQGFPLRSCLSNGLRVPFRP